MRALSGSPNRYRRWKIFARILILIIAVVLVAIHIDRAEIGTVLSRVRLGYMVLVVLVSSPLAVLLRSLRWRFLLRTGKGAPLHAYVGAYLVGVLANSVLLGRFGDLVKARFICRPGVDYARSVSVVIIDRLIEGLALLLIFAVVLLKAPLPHWAYRLAWLAGGASIAALIALRALFSFRGGLSRFAERSLVRLPAAVRGKLLGIVESLLGGCEALTGFRRVITALVYAFAVWAVEIATVAMLLKAFSIRAPYFLAALVLVVILNFGMLVPTSPGAIGVYQWLCVFALSLWSVDRQQALAFGIGMQTILFVPLYLAGSVWLLVATRMKTRKSLVPSPARTEVAPTSR